MEIFKDLEFSQKTRCFTTEPEYYFDSGENDKILYIEDALTDFMSFFEEKDTEKLEEILVFLGQSSFYTDFNAISSFSVSEFVPRIIKILQANPPENVTNAILNILTSLVRGDGEADFSYSDEFVPLIFPLLYCESTVHNSFILLSKVGLVNNIRRDFVMNTITLEKIIEIFELHDGIEQKLDALLFIANMVFFPDFPCIDSIFQFVCGILTSIEIPLQIVCTKIIYFLEIHSRSIITQCGDEICTIIRNIMEQMYQSQKPSLCEFPLKLTKDIISMKKQNDILNIHFTINMMKCQCHNISGCSMDALVAIADNCVNPFNSDDLRNIIVNSRDIMRDFSSILKIKAALLIGSIYPHLHDSEIIFLISFGVIRNISPILFICEGRELFRILKWIYELISKKTDPKVTSILFKTIEETDLLDVLEEIAEDSNTNNDTSQIASLISMQIYYPPIKDGEPSQ